MPGIESISVLRQSVRLDQASQSKEPLYVTKNGRAYLVVLSPELYEEIIRERDHYKQALERERMEGLFLLKIIEKNDQRSW